MMMLIFRVAVLLFDVFMRFSILIGAIAGQLLALALVWAWNAWRARRSRVRQTNPNDFPAPALPEPARRGDAISPSRRWAADHPRPWREMANKRMTLNRRR